MINSILDLSKIEAGKLELHYEEFPVQEAINEVLNTIIGFSNKKGIHIHTHIHEDVPSITVDKVKFKQIMFNLLSNAVKFTPEEWQGYHQCKPYESACTDCSKRHRYWHQI